VRIWSCKDCELSQILVLTYAHNVCRFRVLHDEELGKGDMEGLKDYLRLAELVDAVRNRPNVEVFFELARI
jgi:hypothetical protein